LKDACICGYGTIFKEGGADIGVAAVAVIATWNFQSEIKKVIDDFCNASNHIEHDQKILHVTAIAFHFICDGGNGVFIIFLHCTGIIF